MQDFLQQIREQIGRIWGQISPQQKVIFVSVPLLLLLAMVVSVYLASRPEMVTLISSDDLSRLNEITNYLDSNGIEYKMSGDTTVLVDKEVRSQVRLQLAGQDLIGPDFGPGLELFDQVQLGMTESMFDIQRQRALENTLAEAITEGAREIDNAMVKIVIPTEKLFKSDQAEPTASVKIQGRGTPSQDIVRGIQRLVAAAVENMEPQNVVVVDASNKPLSEDTDVQPGVARATKYFQYKKIVEMDLAQKLERKLEVIVGPENYQVEVTVVLDWEDKKIEKIDIDSTNPAAVSQKDYEEKSTSPGISGQPGVSTNVQDSGLGAEVTVEESQITETILNNQYPWAKTFIQEEQGEIDELSVGISINKKTDEDGNPVDRQPQEITKIENTLKASIGIPVQQQQVPNFQFVLNEIEFDTSWADELAREQFWNNVTNAIRGLLPLVLLLALGYFAYMFFLRAFAPPEVEEEMEEEVPIEPVTEAKELTLAQLGLAEFGDIASLPAEEQRRLKMQEHVINYAAEKPEEVAAIIKAWLSS